MANTFTKTYDYYVGSNAVSDVVVEGTMVIDTAVGADACDIPASFFGLSIITAPAHIVISTNAACYIGVPSYDGTSLLVKAAATTGFADLANGKYSIKVQGR